MAPELTLAQIAEIIGAELRGDGACLIHGLNTLQAAQAGDVAFLANKSYQPLLTATGASAVILHPQYAQDFAGNALVMDNPYAGYARATALFNNVVRPQAGIHGSAVVAASARIDPLATIGPQVTISDDVHIGAGAVIGPGVFIGARSKVGCGTTIFANVSIYHDVTIGEQVVIHSGAVIGADGFGFANDGGKWIKIHQLGGVEIGNRVEVGACTTIDRGALGNTVIEDGVILDNHVQIAHNVRIGENTAMAAYSGIAGSTVVGKNCIFAGQAGAVGHIKVGDNVHAMARCTISKSLDKPGSYSSGLLMYETTVWRKNAARFGQLDDMARRLKKLEKLQTS